MDQVFTWDWMEGRILVPNDYSIISWFKYYNKARTSVGWQERF